MNSLKANKLLDLVSIVPKIMGNLDKLKSFSSDDLDAAKLTQALSEHQMAIIKFVLIAGSLVLAVMMFNDHRSKDSDLHMRISQVQRKLEAIKARETTTRNFNGFKSSLPKKLNEIELISLVSNYAKSSHVTIASLTPAESKDTGLFDLINLSFDAGSNDFKGMMFFLRKIESSEFPLRINAWAGHEEEDGKMTFQVSISAIIIHT